jgi:uncharacterized repeat protein (TIGR03847 family)
VEFYDFDEVDAFTTGTVGRPGARTFFLQARVDGRQVNVKCEKQQVAAIAQYLRRMLSDLPDASDRPMPSSLEALPPGHVSFVLGPIGLSYDPDIDRVVLQLDELSEVDDDGEPILDDDERGKVRAMLTRGQALAFCEHADTVVAAGRPNCVFCGGPIDPDGHPCPRMN